MIIFSDASHHNYLVSMAVDCGGPLPIYYLGTRFKVQFTLTSLSILLLSQLAGLWGLFYYKEIPGAANMIGFLMSSCVVFVGILLMSSDHKG